MKINIILILIMIYLALVGCSSEEVERNAAINEGISAIKNKSFDDATEIFAAQLNKNGDDEQVRSLYRESKCLRNAEKLKLEGKYKEALREFEYIDGVRSSSGTAKKYLEELKAELETKVEEETKAQEERKLKAKEVAARDVIEEEKELEGEKGISGIISNMFKSDKVKDVLGGIKNVFGNLFNSDN